LLGRGVQIEHELAIARSRRASLPLQHHEARAGNLRAPSKSISPSASPISKCCLGSKSNCGAWACRPAHFLIVVLVLAERHLFARQVGNDGQRVASSASILRSSSSPLAIAL
jgi:hypothetical protein